MRIGKNLIKALAVATAMVGCAAESEAFQQGFNAGGGFGQQGFGQQVPGPMQQNLMLSQQIKTLLGNNPQMLMQYQNVVKQLLMTAQQLDVSGQYMQVVQQELDGDPNVVKFVMQAPQGAYPQIIQQIIQNFMKKIAAGQNTAGSGLGIGYLGGGNNQNTFGSGNQGNPCGSGQNTNLFGGGNQGNLFGGGQNTFSSGNQGNLFGGGQNTFGGGNNQNLFGGMNQNTFGSGQNTNLFGGSSNQGNLFGSGNQDTSLFGGGIQGGFGQQQTSLW